MSQYNKTVLTYAGLALAKRANAGQAKFGITRAVTSADDWSYKTVQDLEEVTTIPNIMQQGTIMDTDEVESNNSVIGVSLCFTNKNLSTGYQIRIIGLYVKEEGQENDFLYAVTTAITPEYMPSFADKVLYRFNTQMYLVIGNAQSVNVVINDGTAVTHGQLDKYKAEVTGNLKTLENTHKEDMGHVAKSASINGGAEILPDSTGKLNLVVPGPDLSKYVSLEQLGELLQAKANVADVNKQIKAVTDLANTKANTVDVDSKIKTVTDLANTKANSADVYTKTETDNQINKFDLSKVKFRKQYINGDGQTADKTWSATKNDDGTYTIDLYNDDWTAAKLYNLINQVKQIDGETVISDAVDVNTLVGTPNQITVYKLSNIGNTNAPSWFSDNRGVMIVLNYDGNAKTQIWTPVGTGAPNTDGTFGWRYWEGNNPTAWNRFASVSYVDNLHNDLQNQINANDEGTITTGYDWNTGTPTNESRPLQNAWIVDQTALRGAVDRMNSINSNANGRLSLGGGNMNLRSTINWNGGEINDRTGNLGGLNWAGGTDWAKIYGDQDGNDNLDLAFDLGDDGSNHFSFRRNGTETAGITSDGLFTGRINWNNVNGLTDPNITAGKIANHDTRLNTLEQNQFEVQTFTDATAAANWEAQKPGHRLAIVNK